MTLTFNTPIGEDFFPFQFSFQYTDCFCHPYEAVYEIRSMSELFLVSELRLIPLSRQEIPTGPSETH